MHIYRTTGRDGWSCVIESSRRIALTPPIGKPIEYPAYGVALLFYRPEKRLSVSLWGFGRSTNIRLWGPKKLSFEQ